MTAPAPEFLSLGPADAVPHLLLAHGAGAAMTSPFLETMARLLADAGLATHRFEFAYMAARRHGARKPPPRAERLMPEYIAAVEAMRASLPTGSRLLIGGKSMGGRVASMVADELYRQSRISGLVCLGYPFHPPGKPEALRTAHLADLACPTLIVQGERDPFGTRKEVAGYALPRTIAVHWAPDGDHDLKPRRGSGHTGPGNLRDAAGAIAAFARSI